MSCAMLTDSSSLTRLASSLLSSFAGRAPPRSVLVIDADRGEYRQAVRQTSLAGLSLGGSFRMMPQSRNWGAPSVIAALAGLVQD
jgi:hypothetical protein